MRQGSIYIYLFIYTDSQSNALIKIVRYTNKEQRRSRGDGVGKGEEQGSKAGKEASL